MTSRPMSPTRKASKIATLLEMLSEAHMRGELAVSQGELMKACKVQSLAGLLELINEARITNGIRQFESSGVMFFEIVYQPAEAG